MKTIRFILRISGSLWFAVVLLGLLMLSMGSATVFEVTHGTERALGEFYHALWFEIILILIGLNLLSALILRFPFSRRQSGLVITHAGIILTLAGAVITDHFGIDGKVGIAEGQTVDTFGIPVDTLTAMNLADRTVITQELDSSEIGGYEAVDHPGTGDMSLGKLGKIEIVGYQPDLVWQQRILNDSSTPNPAVEVVLSSGSPDAVWIFAGQTASLGMVSGTFRMVADRKELDRLLSDASEGMDVSLGKAKLEYRDSVIELPIQDCMEDPVPIGNTGYKLRVLRYLPHAVVVENQKVDNASQQPHNPAIEAEIEGPEGTDRRLAFANFPDFRSMHGEERIKDLKLTFISSVSWLPTQPVEVLGSPDGDLYVRFFWSGTKVVSKKLEIGVPVDAPMPGIKFTVLQHLDNARAEYVPTPPNPIRKNREPALLIKLTTPEKIREMWLQKFSPEVATVGGTPYELTYGNKPVPLGYQLTLNRFRLGFYPGGEKVRSYESFITITDLGTGRTLDRIVSMNNPVSYGGYSIYQSSYRQDGQQTVSFLSVSRDPGQMIAFAGYIATIGGLLLMLGIRMQEQRKRKKHSTEEVNSRGTDE